MTAKLHRNKDIIATAFGNLLKKEGISKDGIPFVGGVNDNTPFRTTQYEAITAGQEFVLHDENGHKGYFEIATGIGKTVIFLSLVKESYFEALRRGINDFNSVIVVPTRQLVGQTQKSFEDYVPELKGKIGLYGDGHTDLSKPITVITYVAWQKLVEAGILNYENTDLLISDEAHRGISERQVENFFNGFGDETVSFAFTATSEFDLSKSVELTHGTKIYAKHLSDGVRGNELAAYIQTQLHEIGIETPDLTDEFNEEAQRFNQDPNYRAALKREAWNRFALEQFKAGKDDHTGDFLHENKAAFFVADTTHADDLETMLNEDIQLQFLAKSRGLKGVSVSIHSRLLPAEQKRRLKDYLAGKYLAVIGADQFKEGFDYPELKTVFDYPRGSLVDKSQILGRGGRKWWNEAKDRWEGMTFIDTVIYFDEPDPEASERNRENALKYAVLASSIIDGSHILSEAEEKKQKDNPKKPSSDGGFGPVFADDLNVTSHTTLNQIKAIHAEIALLNKEHWIELTEEMRVNLISEMQRTGLGSRRLSDALNKNFNDDFIDHYNLDNWIQSAKTVDSYKFEAVLEFLSNQPDSSKKFNLDNDSKLNLASELDRTGLSAWKLAQIVSEKYLEKPISGSLISGWLKDVNFADEFLFNTIMNFLKDYDSSQKTDFTDEMKVKFFSESKRTGIGGKRICNIVNAKYGEGYASASRIDNWSMSTKTVEKNIYDAVIDCLQSLPDSRMILYTAKMKEYLQSEVKRTNAGPKKLARLIQEDENIHEKVDHRTIYTWLKEISPSEIDQIQFNSVIGFLATLPTVDLETRIALTDEMRSQYRSEMDRSGINFPSLTKKIIEAGIDNITEDQLRSWIDPALKNVSSVKFASVMSLLKACPNKDSKTVLLFTSEMKERILFELERTGLGVVTLPRELGIPSITKSIFQNFLKNDGKERWIEEEMYKKLISFLEDYPDAPDMLIINDEIKNEVRMELGRTGLSQRSLVQQYNNSTGEKFPLHKLANWLFIKKDMKSDAKKFNDLFKFLKDLPDKENFFVTAEMLLELESTIDRKGIGLKTLYRLINANEIIVARGTIDRWFANRDNAPISVEKDRWDAVISFLDSQPDAKPKPPKPPMLG